MNDIIVKMGTLFVTKEEFAIKMSPIEKIVYGFTGIILVAVGTALVYLVIRK